MNPIPANQANSSKEVQRLVLCKDYNRCLDMAVRAAWNGFSCSDCQDYELEEGWDLSYWQVQHLRAADVLIEIMIGH
jgi:hypothetical protein